MYCYCKPKEKYFKSEQRKVEETEICYRYLKREILQICRTGHSVS